MHHVSVASRSFQLKRTLEREMRSTNLLFLALPALLTACGGTEVLYGPASDDEIRTQTDGELLFQLRTTNITLLPPQAGDAKSGAAVAASEVCSTAVGNPKNADQAKSTTKMSANS